MNKLLISILLFNIMPFCFGQQSILPKQKDIKSEQIKMNIDSIQIMLDSYEQIQLPPLSVFLQSVYSHPSLQIYEARQEEEVAILKDTKRKWLDYFRLSGLYQYGQVAGFTKSTDTDVLSYSFDSKAQNQYNIGMVISIPFGDLTGQKQRVRAQKARLRQIEYQYEISVEERKLKILEAYNTVIEQLATLKAKSDAAALYNAQMKISEQDFINGKIDIITLSLERGRRSDAVVKYQEGRATLHNAITLLEMLTNVKIIK